MTLDEKERKEKLEETFQSVIDGYQGAQLLQIFRVEPDVALELIIIIIITPQAF